MQSDHQSVLQKTGGAGQTQKSSTDCMYEKIYNHLKYDGEEQNRMGLLIIFVGVDATVACYAMTATFFFFLNHNPAKAENIRMPEEGNGTLVNSVVPLSRTGNGGKGAVNWYATDPGVPEPIYSNITDMPPNDSPNATPPDVLIKPSKPASTQPFSRLTGVILLKNEVSYVNSTKSMTSVGSISFTTMYEYFQLLPPIFSTSYITLALIFEDSERIVNNKNSRYNL